MTYVLYSVDSDECFGVASTLDNLAELVLDLWHDDGLKPSDYTIVEE